MANERATVFQTVQIGIESVPGTAVPANRKLNSLMIEPSPKADISVYRPAGDKYNTVTAMGKEWTTAKVSGVATYTELAYFLSGLYGNSSAAVGTSGATKWNFNPVSSGADTYNTFTIEKGSATQAERTTQNFIQGWGYKFDRNGMELSGDMLGRALETGITMTAAPTALDLIPILGKQIAIYAETTSAATATPTNKLTRVLSGEFSQSDTKAPVWAMDPAISSYSAVVESVPKTEFKMTLEADTVGLGFLDKARTGETIYLVVQATGDAIGDNSGTTVYYGFKHVLALKVSDIQEFSDKDGLYAIGFGFVVVDDSTWGKAHTIELTNKITTL